MRVENFVIDIAKKIKHFRKDWGIFFTPQWVVDFMVSLIDEQKLHLKDLKLLEPACGMCQFLNGIRKNKREIFDRASRRVGVEINKEIINYVYQNHLVDKDIEFICQDYLLWEPGEKFDVIIGNPPYGIPSLSEHYSIKVDDRTKKVYKNIYETWYGKYNLYGAFIEKSVKLLKENGNLIFIVPATFMILDEFKKLRVFLAKNGITEIIYMGSGVFKPDADVTTVILKFTRSESEKNKLFLYDYRDGILNLITSSNCWNGEAVLFSTEFSKKVDKICSFRLGDLYTVRISPRTPEIKHSPYVIKSEDLKEKKDMLPILNSRNLERGKIIYKPVTGYWIKNTDKTKLREFFDKPHIVVGLGFRGNGCVGAAYDYRAYPWMGDVYHLLRKYTLHNVKFDLSDKEVVRYLNSEIVSKYIKSVFRDITYHFNITQLQLIPLPTSAELKKLKLKV